MFMKKFVVLLFISTIIGSALGQKKYFELDDIFNNKALKPDGLDALTPMGDGKHYTSLVSLNKDQAIVKYSYRSGKAVDTLVKASQLEEYQEDMKIDYYRFTPDESRILIGAFSEKIYRYSTRENNFIYDLKSKTLKLISPGGKQRYATISPDGKNIAYVRGNNLFVRNLKTNNETQVTTDGLSGQIINGATDWVYEEEFAFDKAFFWSPDGKKIAYYTFDESEVKEFSLTYYGDLYPNHESFKYPKAGEVNSKVSLHIFSLDPHSIIDVKIQGDYEYIPRIKWSANPGILTVQTMNRHQNELSFHSVDASTGISTILFEEKSDTYLEIDDDLTFLPDKKQFIWSSEKSGYKHLYLYNLSDGSEVKQITSGDWEVSEYLGYHSKKKVIYYISTEASELERNLYSVSISKGTKKLITPEKGTHSISFSTDYTYFIDQFTSANKPLQIGLYSRSGKKIRTIEDNQSFQDSLNAFALGKKEFFEFYTKDSTLLNGWMIKPPDFEEGRKYPVLMYVYGGPGSQTVTNSWGRHDHNLWYQLLAQQGYIIASVDNRGTGARGKKFRDCTYKQLGVLETSDQIEAAKYLSGLDYVDGRRMGIWGWSYGGYMSSNCLMQKDPVFRMAIAVAPVSHWKFYDSIYTERYMQTPKENKEGYEAGSPINKVGDLQGHFLLVHGGADDNVHPQNTYELVEALVQKNKQFDLFIYPNKNHGIYGGNTRRHLFTKLTDFVLENL